MLLIDAAAKDGNVHLVSGEGWKEPTLAWWYSSLNCWLAQDGGSLPIQPTHYVPMPLLMHAAKMREQLEALAELVESDLQRDLVKTRALLAATEWPKKEG